MKPRDSFVFYRSFLDALEGLDADTQNEFFMAIAQYGLNGILPTFTVEINPNAKRLYLPRFKK